MLIYPHKAEEHPQAGTPSLAASNPVIQMLPSHVSDWEKGMIEYTDTAVLLLACHPPVSGSIAFCCGFWTEEVRCVLSPL